MNRKEIREQIFKLLFRVEFNAPADMEEQLQLHFEENAAVSAKDREEITGKYQKIVDIKDEIDKEIDEKAVGWGVKRLGKVDLTILRLAVYEIEQDENVPPSVAINEAVELAKKFGQDESPAFINGILAKFVK